MKNRTKPRKDLKTERALTIVNRGVLKKKIKRCFQIQLTNNNTQISKMEM